MKGIVLAGGSGTRLYPMTKAISKQLIPIYDKPMIYYPVSVLMLAGIKEILIISTERDTPSFQELFGDGRHLGLDISYKVQKEPKGIAEAFIIGEEFIGDDSVALVLGDNIFYGTGLREIVTRSSSNINGATIFGYYVKNPYEFGVVEFDANNSVISIEEKPKIPKSNYAVPGLYFYDNTVVKKSKSIVESNRGELEITSINMMYLEEGNLNVELFGRGMAWLDTGTYNGLLEASNFVETIQSRQGLYIGCLEEISYRMGYITNEELISLGNINSKTTYGEYLLRIAKEV
ncbi:MAG: glucose-1-phosphate thymidylyltransferase RfbA [Acidaminobacteraceae bacterium]